MDRGIACGSKICAKRMEQRAHDLHRDRVRNIKKQVDTNEPGAIAMEHVRNNLKREQMLEERYSDIDRENRILLKKMSEIMKNPATPRDGPDSARSAGPQSLNRDARKKELLRITKDNQLILKRIQQAQPVYNHVEWEGWHKKKVSYLKNCAEYPLVLKTPRRGNMSSELVPLGTAPEDEERPQSDRSSPRVPMSQGIPSQQIQQDVRYVFKQGLQIRNKYYLIEMATDGESLNITAYDGETQTTLELLVQEKVHRRLYNETNGDYSAIAQRLSVEGRRLILEELGQAPASARSAPAPQSAAAMDSGTAASAFRSPQQEESSSPQKTQRGVSPEEIDAEAMMVYSANPGSAGSFGAQIGLGSTGEFDPQVRLRGLTPSSGGGGGRQASR